MNSKIKTIPDFRKMKSSFKRGRKTVGMVTGCFDILHYEHVDFLAFAKRHADVLIVGLESDRNVRLFKGTERPVFSFKERAFILSSLEFVDFIFKVPDLKKREPRDSFYESLMKKVNPDILITNIFQDHFWEKKKKITDKLGIKIVKHNKKPKISSSKIYNKILSIN